MLAINAVIASNDALIPVAGDYLSLTGLARLMLTLQRLQPMLRRPLHKAMFLSRFVARRRLAQEVYGKLLQHFSDNLLNSSISEAAVLAECAGVGKPFLNIVAAASRRGSSANWPATSCTGDGTL